MIRRVSLTAVLLVAGAAGRVLAQAQEHNLYLVFTGICTFVQSKENPSEVAVLLPRSDFKIRINKKDVPAHRAYVRFAPKGLRENWRTACHDVDTTNTAGKPEETACVINNEDLKVEGPFKESTLDAKPLFFTKVPRQETITHEPKIHPAFLNFATWPTREGLTGRMILPNGHVDVASDQQSVWEFRPEKQGGTSLYEMSQAVHETIALDPKSNDPIVLTSNGKKSLVFDYPKGNLTLEFGVIAENEVWEDPKPDAHPLEVGEADPHFLLHYQLRGTRKCKDLKCREFLEECKINADDAAAKECPLPYLYEKIAKPAKTQDLPDEVAGVLNHRPGGSNCPPTRFTIQGHLFANATKQLKSKRKVSKS